MSQDEPKKRNRAQRSCNPCRSGKLKCDRELPCSECVKRSREPACTYSKAMQESMAYRSQAKVMRQKLDKLERVVQQLRDHGAPVEGDRDAEPQNDIPTGRFKMTGDEETYYGPSHWESIITDLQELRAHVEAGGSSQSPETTIDSSPGASDQVSTPDLFFSSKSILSMQDLVSYLPAKSICDRLISAYFRSADIHMHIVHVPTFQQQYAQFWTQPLSVPPVWLALLFDILALGSQYSSKGGRSEEQIQQGRQLHEMSAHAIVLADYAKPKMYILEAILLFIRYGQMQNIDNQLKLWLTIGLVTRLATRMGMYRDPSQWPEISPFVSEMRKRIWLCICHMDILFSYQIGLVSTIRALQANMPLPSNLDDTDFGPQTKQLPPSKPLTTRTNVTYSIIAMQIISIFGQAVSMSHATVSPDYTEIQQLHQQLEELYHNIPENMKMRPLDQCFGDSPYHIMERLRLASIYQKGRCVLFRRYLGTDRKDDRMICVSAAREILKLQALLDEAIQPGGQLEVCHDQHIRDCTDCFILADTIIGVELSQTRDRLSKGGQTYYSPAELDDMQRALEESVNTWAAWPFAQPKAKQTALALGKIISESSNFAPLTTALQATPATWQGSATSLSTASPASPSGGKLSQGFQPLGVPLEFTFGTSELDELFNYSVDDNAAFGDMFQSQAGGMGNGQGMDWTVFDSMGAINGLTDSSMLQDQVQYAGASEPPIGTNGAS